MSYKVMIRQGNLLNEENATFIVNASNTKLILGSGVSMDFKRHCGYELQKEMNTIINTNIKQGDVILTSSVNATNFKYCLHVAIMNYHLSMNDIKRKPSINTIKKSLDNIEKIILEYSEKYNKTIKLVIPLLGCGVGGLDKLEIIKLYKYFFSKNIKIYCEVIIYGYNNEDFKLIKKYWI